MMIKKVIIGATLAAMTMTGATALADNHLPGEGKTVKPARATWDTGFFQEALVARGLETLGYEVEKPKTLVNPIFYNALTLGDIDYWTNGWFPMHNDQIPSNFDEKAEKVGYVMKAGGLGGYLVSKKEADKYNITSLDDFKRPEVKKAFDTNGDGKADLIACPAGWGCEKVISHHMDAYDLKDSINPVKAAYAAGIASGMAGYKNGGPIFFYTWAPNWTIFKMKPGKDVVWINVPEINPTKGQSTAVERMTVNGLEGAVSDPIKLGFVASDIRIVANKKFTKENPAARKFFEVFTLPLADVNEQNTQMNNGEKSAQDIQGHVDEWIAKNQDKWNAWLTEAKNAAK